VVEKKRRVSLVPGSLGSILLCRAVEYCSRNECADAEASALPCGAVMPESGTAPIRLSRCLCRRS
jgi:hypothetical protein